MSHRHIPRSERDRDVRIHDPPNSLSHPPHPPLVNGSAAISSTPAGMSNGSAHHPHALVSPSVATTVPNGNVTAPTSSIHKLASANEQTWLLIGLSLPLLPPTPF
jgi:glucose repression mediator protein